MGEQGQLGRLPRGRNSTEACLVPRSISFKAGRAAGRFTDVFCGSYHTFVLQESVLGKRLFAFGLNNHGQLGTGMEYDEGEEAFTHEPELVEIEGEVVEAAAGGEHHSLILTESGMAFASLNL